MFGAQIRNRCRGGAARRLCSSRLPTRCARAAMSRPCERRVGPHSHHDRTCEVPSVLVPPLSCGQTGHGPPSSSCIRKVRTGALAVVPGARRMEPARGAAAVAKGRAGCSRERQLGEPGDLPSGDLALRQLIARNRPPAWRVPRSTVTIDPECQEGINGSSLAAPLVRLSQRGPQYPRRNPWGSSRQARLRPVGFALQGGRLRSILDQRVA